MSLSQEQAAFLRDMCKLVEYASSQGFMVTPLAKERRRSFEITYLGVKVHRPLSPHPKPMPPTGAFFI